MPNSALSGAFRRRLTPVLAVVCVILLAVFSTVAVAHSHPAAAHEDAAHCSLCMATHAPAVSQPVASIPIPVELTAETRPADAPEPAVQPIRGQRYSRPPPQLLRTQA